jgi:hypothetical protein
MKRLILGFVIILFSIQATGCDSGGGAGAPPTPAGGAPAKGASDAPKGGLGPANPNGPKNDH